MTKQEARNKLALMCRGEKANINGVEVVFNRAGFFKAQISKRYELRLHRVNTRSLKEVLFFLCNNGVFD